MIKISVVVPVYNMVNTINETLSSILNQNYKNLELIVIDGNSNDGTYNYLKERRESIDFLISEPDNGQYYAIQKGFKLATGEIISWLNADDVYMPWTLNYINQVFSRWDDINWVYGIPSFLNEKGNLTNIYNISSKHRSYIKNGDFRSNVFGYLQQESMFFKKKMYDEVGGLNLNLKFAADFELWTKFAEKSNLVALSLPLAAFRKSKKNRSVINKNKYSQEVDEIIKLKRKRIFIEKISKKFKLFNLLIRLLIYKKTDIIYYSLKSQKIERKKKLLPLSSISFRQMFFEL